MLCKVKCLGKRPCDGNNHFSKHHRQQLRMERGQCRTFKCKGKGKGKATGQYVHIKGRGKGKHISSMSSDGMLTCWLDEDGSWYDANGTYEGAHGGINSIIVTTGGIELQPEEDEVMLDSRPAECQQDEISEIKSYVSNLPVTHMPVSPVFTNGPDAAVLPVTNLRGCVPCKLFRRPLRYLVWQREGANRLKRPGQHRMSAMRKVCVISANSGPRVSGTGGVDCAASAEVCGAGGTVGGLSIVVGGNDKDRAGSSNTVAGGVRETSHVEGILGQDWTTVF